MAQDSTEKPTSSADVSAPWGEDLDMFLESTATPEPLSFGKIAVRRILRDRLTLAAMGILLILIILSALAGVISEKVLNVNPNSTDLLIS
jgi:hypothetical protein